MLIDTTMTVTDQPYQQPIGAEEVFSLLPHEWVRVEDLPALVAQSSSQGGCAPVMCTYIYKDRFSHSYK